jgi:ubiquinone biosynthesis protein
MKNFAESIVDNEHRGSIADLPRRPHIQVSENDTDLPQMRFVSFETSHVNALKRFFSWIGLLFYFYSNTLLDALLGRDTNKRRALRLRHAFERNGGSFIKLGIHLSVRVDLIPWTYSNELSCMTDHMPPFPVVQAIAIIERTLKKPLSAVFSRFDPQPILSTSVACVYQAILRNGDKVAVKVRRPGIGEQFMADLQAFGWLLSIAEFLTIFRPGLTKGMRDEFRSLLLEELDFVQEARRQDAFRRKAEESRKRFFSAPQIYLEFSGEEVVVNGFASGMWLWELLAAVEVGNQAVLDQARALNIDPGKVARRLLWVNYWSREENLFFHANPTSNNIIIGPDSKLYFINFASTGTLGRTRQQAMSQNLYYAWLRDPQNMARSSLVLMEPLPPIDLIELTQELETYNWQLLYSLEASPNSQSWQDRTSAMQWVGIINLARKYGISIDIEVLRLLRATLLTESMALRLDPEIDFVEQYRKFIDYKAEQARRRVTETILERLDGKSTEQLIIRIDRVFQTVEGLLNRTIHQFSLPSVNFNVLMSKWSYAVTTLVRFITFGCIVTAAAVGLGAAYSYIGTRQPINLQEVFTLAVTNPFYQLIILVLLFVNGRTVLFRLDDKEV